MSQSIATINQFSFSARELPAKLLEHIHSGETGYWQHEFDRLADRQSTFYWNLGIANGQIVYSGNRIWSAQMLLRIAERYVPSIRSTAKSQIEMLRRKVQVENLSSTQVLAMMNQSNIITEAQLLAALRVKILNDLDIYLLMGGGSAKFIAEDIGNQLPVDGFSPINLLDEAEQRQLQWTQLRQHVPSMKLCPVIDQAAIAKANLPDSQRQRIEKMAQSDKSLNLIAEGMAKDNLEVAQMFAKLGRIGLVKFQPPQKHTIATVMVIDDSPVLLSQFNHWVSALGYVVATCQEAKNAIEAIKKAKPSVIFIDINMPEISGFELVKQIRQQPDLRAIPLTILTGEQKLSNKWRAQWSGCEFLTKPLTSTGIGDFQVQLEELIPRLLNPALVKVETHTN
ncbi:MAG: response regulator [Chamaesiphon sp.]|nr:response regulator [Chamaesiphon sp.]